MRKLSYAALLIFSAAILGATVFNEPVATAAQSIGATIVGPLDSNGNLMVHEQGTANVKVVETREPFERRVDIPLADGQFSDEESFVIPSGKRFVAEFISVSVSLPLNQTPLASFNAFGATVGGVVPLQSQGVARGSDAFFSGNSSILDFTEGGASFRVGFERAHTSTGTVSGTAYMHAFVSGYLEPTS